MTSKVWLPKEGMHLKIVVTERETMLADHPGAGLPPQCCRIWAVSPKGRGIHG